jgi:cytoskeletal protein CcmA (bactofilin family)
MATVKTNPGTETHVTVIGDSVRVRGNLSGDEDLHVLGRVDGRIELQRTLVVAPSGIVKAEVVVKNAVVSGVVVGNISASESVELTREGRMVGDIFAPRVIIVDGASFRGTVDMGDFEHMPVRTPQAERSRPVSTSVATTRPVPAASSPSRPAAPPPPRPTSTPPRPVTPPPAPVVSVSAPPPAAMVPAPPQSPDDGVEVEEVEEVEEDGVEAAGLPTDPPAARGLPHKAQKARVIVKRR